MAQDWQIGSEPGFSVKLKSLVRSSSILMLLLLLCTGAWTAEENLLHNGDLREGTLNDPADWRAESLRHDPKTFSWSQPPGAPGELQITSGKDVMARWSQTVNLAPGWYRLSGELRTENIEPEQGNAQIGVFAGGVIWSLPIKITRSPDWNSGVLYFKIATPRVVPIVCLLVAPRGTAHFRRILLTRTSTPPHEADQVDLEAKLTRFEQFTRRTVPQGFKPPTGSRWTVPATILTLIAITLLGWFGFKRGETD
jgi:hypothetical protein